MNTSDHTAFLNGEFTPASELSIPVYDSGFVLGATVAEQLRTFGGRLFRLEHHLERFFASLELIDLVIPYSRGELESAAQSIVEVNHVRIDRERDLGLCLFATPGPYSTMAPVGVSGPIVAMHTYPLPFHRFAVTYRSWQALVTTDVPQIPAASLPRDLKCRSRIHYYLADLEAARSEPGSRALMLDSDGSVLEATTANVLIYHQDEGLISPPPERILPGITVAATLEIAAKLGIPHTHRDISVEEFASAEEALLTSTSVCVLPVTSLNRRPLGTGRPGPVFKQLLEGWRELTGIDVAAQAHQFANR